MTLNYEDYHHLYPLPNVIKKMKSWTMRWERHTACTRDLTWRTVFVRKPEGYRPI